MRLISFDISIWLCKILFLPFYIISPTPLISSSTIVEQCSSPSTCKSATIKNSVILLEQQFASIRNTNLTNLHRIMTRSTFKLLFLQIRNGSKPTNITKMHSISIRNLHQPEIRTKTDRKYRSFKNAAAP